MLNDTTKLEDCLILKYLFTKEMHKEGFSIYRRYFSGIYICCHRNKRNLSGPLPVILMDVSTLLFFNSKSSRIKEGQNFLPLSNFLLLEEKKNCLCFLAPRTYFSFHQELYFNSVLHLLASRNAEMTTRSLCFPTFPPFVYF